MKLQRCIPLRQGGVVPKYCSNCNHVCVTDIAQPILYMVSHDRHAKSVITVRLGLFNTWPPLRLGPGVVHS